jgi:hypothetical protein
MKRYYLCFLVLMSTLFFILSTCLISPAQELLMLSPTGGGGALSADGNTAIVGQIAGSGAHVYTKSSGVWSQQGFLQPISNDFYAIGGAVALSSDGNTAVVDGDHGFVFVFIRSGNIWHRDNYLAFTHSSTSPRQ